MGTGVDRVEVFEDALVDFAQLVPVNHGQPRFLRHKLGVEICCVIFVFLNRRLIIFYDF